MSRRSARRWTPDRAARSTCTAAANYRVTAFYAIYAQRRGLCTPEEADALVQSVWDPAEFPAWQALIGEQASREVP